MFERFTEKAIKVIMLAQEEARRLGHNFVGTEQVLLGLIGEGTGVAAKTLKSMGVNLKDARVEVEKIIGRGSGFVAVEIPFTPRAKRVLELSWDEARQFGHNYIGTEHLLLGLIREGEGVAARVLDNLGVDLAKVRQHIIRLLGESSSADTSGATGGSLLGVGSSGAGKAGSAQQGGRTRTPTLDEFGTDLTLAAQEGRLDPVIGRAEEIERVIQILGRRTKNNPVLIGEPGVGKTAVSEGLASRIVSDDIPELLDGKKLVMLDLGLLVAGTKYRGEFEERLKKIMDEIRSAGNIMLVIDELHTLIGAGAAEGAIDAANILKPALARGELQCIGTTTLDEYRKHIERDAALERRFQPVVINSPSVEETIDILRGLRQKYEDHHKLIITDKAIEAAATLSDRYIFDRFLPDKAIDLVDEASSRVRLRASSLPPEGKELENDLTKISRNKEEAIRNQEFEKASQLRDEENDLRDKIREIQEEWKKEQEKNKPKVEEEEIAHIVSCWTGIPIGDLKKGENEKLKNMEDIIHCRVIGQDPAVTAVSKAIRRARSGLKNPERPIGSFIFCGPTGVGKTELAKVLADYFFGSAENLIRVDMSEYMEKHTVSKLIGSPPGYVGYGDGGQLTEAVRRKPYSVVLFDEIEKGHPDVFNVMLQMLDDGHLTDSRGRKVSFKNTIIIMTSNVGANRMSNTGGIGFFSGNKEKAEENEYQRMKEAVMEEVKRAFKPEFINRLDDVVVFRHLNRDDMRLIVNILIKELELRLKEHGMTIELTDDVKDKVATEGYKRAFGARPMKRSIQKLLEDEISDELINERLGAGNKVKASLVFDAEFPKEKDYSKEEKQPTDDTKEADIRQALIKAKVKFEVIGQYTEEEQEALKKSTIKTKNKVLTLSSTGASVGGASKEPAGNKTA
ncbi:MAG: ATP-dependent Clp protease ATP-binding subunit [Candidatus Melainabacteria bacterium]|jgi:ATP-dependent Clp protease ATP-binding subunit ClpC|nr:ATP-dependent Clp protease ATP-binding subunit [Candidatus Melainabacteria bacterium]